MAYLSSLTIITLIRFRMNSFIFITPDLGNVHKYTHLEIAWVIIRY